MEEEETLSMDDVMFVVGAQATDDGDLLSSSFTVFPNDTAPQDAVGVIAHKIMHDIEKLEIDHTHGSMIFRRIKTWQEFAEVDIDDVTKMKALSEALVESFLDKMMESHFFGGIVAVGWVPFKAPEDPS